MVIGNRRRRKKRRSRRATLIKKLRMFAFGWKEEDLHPDFKMVYPWLRILPIIKHLFPDQVLPPRGRMILAAQMKYEIMREHFWNDLMKFNKEGDES